MPVKPLKNLVHVAAVHAAAKKLAELDKAEGNPVLPPGCSIDISGCEVVVRFEEGSTVDKAAGKDGDGVRPTTASTNLNGWAALTVMRLTLEKFKQAGRIDQALIDAIADAIITVNGTTEKALLEQRGPAFEKEIARTKRELGGQLPKREETTRRYIKTPVEPAISVGRQAAVKVA
jgi:hypothetical protein